MRHFAKLGVVVLVCAVFSAGCVDSGAKAGDTPGVEGGPCYGNRTCNAGLVCNSENICEVPDVDPCSGVSCSGHGSCLVANGDTPVCICDSGYHPEGLDCVENNPDEPCTGVDCSGHGTCAVLPDDTPTCICDEGYEPRTLNCIPVTDLCSGVTCSGHGHCVEYQGNPECVCDEGYHADGLDCLQDIDPCSGVTCSGHGFCVLHNSIPECICDPGYHAQGLDCEPIYTCQIQVLDDVPTGSLNTWTLFSTAPNPVVSYSETNQGYQGSNAIFADCVGTTTAFCEQKNISKVYDIGAANTDTSSLTAYLVFTSNQTQYNAAFLCIEFLDSADNNVGDECYYRPEGMGTVPLMTDPDRFTLLTATAESDVYRIDFSAAAININYAKINIKLVNYACIGTNTTTFDHLVFENHCP